MNPFTAELAAERIRDLRAAARTRTARPTRSTRNSPRRSSR
jgi:hypothetical protein